MSVFTWLPSYPASQPMKPKVNKASFGDGYEQRSGDGVNFNPRTWNLQFNQRTAAEIEAIDAFLSARGAAQAFDWTPPFGATGRFVCEAWEPSLPQSVYYSLTATFREVFEP